MLDDAWRAVAELAASQHGAFTRAQAAVMGIDSRRIRTAVRDGRITQRAPGVLVVSGCPSSYRQRLRVVTLLGCGTNASHRAAASLHDFDGCAEGRPEISVRANQQVRVPAGLDVVVHQVDRLTDDDLTTVDGIPCTGIARTLADLGDVVSKDVVHKALIGLRRNRTSLRWLRLTAQRAHRPGQRGPALLLRLLDQIQREGTVPESWLEEVLKGIIRDPALPMMVSQHELRDERGTLVARFDHAFPDIKLAIEGHSRQFHFGPICEALDEDRDLRAGTHGWEIVYLGWYAQRRPAEVVDAIVKIAAHRRHSPTT